MPTQRSSLTAGTSVKRFGPGEGAEPVDYDTGDFILTHGNVCFSKLIRFGQGLRFLGPNRKYTWWSHAAMIVSTQGDLIEALGAGVQRTKIEKYRPTEYHVVRLGTLATPHDRDQVKGFAEWCVGQKYDWLTILSIAVSLLTGCKFSFGFDGHAICSGLVARALERTNAIFDRTPSHIMPADLAKYFSVEPPPHGTGKGTIPDS